MYAYRIGGLGEGCMHKGGIGGGCMNIGGWRRKHKTTGQTQAIEISNKARGKAHTKAKKNENEDHQ